MEKHRQNDRQQGRRRGTATTPSLDPPSRSVGVLDPQLQALLELQRTAGNRAVTERLRDGRPSAVLQRDSGTATVPAPAPAPAAAPTTPAALPDPDDIAWIDSLSVNRLQDQIDTEQWSKAKEAGEEKSIRTQGEAEVAAYTAAQQKKIAKLTKAKQADKAAAGEKETEARVGASRLPPLPRSRRRKRNI